MDLLSSQAMLRCADLPIWSGDESVPSLVKDFDSREMSALRSDRGVEASGGDGAAPGD